MACAALGLLGACGNDSADGPSSFEGSKIGEGELDTTPVEQMLIARQKQATPDLNVTESRCPARAELRKGAKFGCSVLVEDLPAPYTVTVTSVNTSSKTADYEFELTKAVLSTAKLRDAVRQTLTDKGAEVECGPGKARLAAPESLIECGVTDREGSRPVTLKVENIEGKVVPA